MGVLSGKLKSLGKILIVMMGSTAMLLFLLALLVQRLHWTEGVISIGISLVYVISCFLGGFLTGKIQQKRKFLWGLLMGFLYLFVILAVTMTGGNGGAADGKTFLVNLMLCLGGGMLGGMLS